MEKLKANHLLLESPPGWADYELLDCGDFEKLERFGNYILIRPEPQAIWPKMLDDAEWMKLANGRFVRDNSKKSHRNTDNDQGGWTKLKALPESWKISYNLAGKNLVFKLALTSFGHIGIFPEQANNWNYVRDRIHEMGKANECKLLNLFAYTGGLSVAARSQGAEVSHVDSVKSIITWANENQQLSGLDGIRWVIEDAIKFARREATRGNKYQGIVLDPPAYGRGPKGEKWILEDLLPELMSYCKEILDPHKGFFILNLYSMGWSALMAENMVKSYFPKAKTELGEFYLPAKSGLRLPMGIFLRFHY
jgi:23S rRNA (cytosine1962-C5)-methyltransferase